MQRAQKLTPAQKRDLLWIRHTYLLRYAQNRNQRAVLLERVQAPPPLDSTADTWRTGDHFISAAETMQQLQANVKEEHSNFVIYMTAMSQGVSPLSPACLL